jgi:hypothetical protein
MGLLGAHWPKNSKKSFPSMGYPHLTERYFFVNLNPACPFKSGLAENNVHFAIDGDEFFFYISPCSAAV